MFKKYNYLSTDVRYWKGTIEVRKISTALPTHCNSENTPDAGVNCILGSTELRSIPSVLISRDFQVPSGKCQLDVQNVLSEDRFLT